MSFIISLMCHVTGTDEQRSTPPVVCLFFSDCSIIRLPFLKSLKIWPVNPFHPRGARTTLSTVVRDASYAYACDLICSLLHVIVVIMNHDLKSAIKWLHSMRSFTGSCDPSPQMLPQVKSSSWPITCNASWFLSLTGALYQRSHGISDHLGECGAVERPGSGASLSIVKLYR